jgi:hypothetical protein
MIYSQLPVAIAQRQDLLRQKPRFNQMHRQLSTALRRRRNSTPMGKRDLNNGRV